jgi:rSAM/selenodomain-associated transferase 2/rSAM/selenodomain-associated transferase 1
VSKISGTARGVILAGTKILYTIMRAALQPSRNRAVRAREKVCVFTRYPEAGVTKTRLIPALGAESAACLQHAMTAHLLCAAAVANVRNACVEVRFEGGDEARMRESFGDAFSYRRQGDGDLGERMGRCARESLESGVESVVIVGSDIPGVGADILTKAFDALRNHDLVIGPATDGGYYLIGLRREVPELFADMPWGTAHVFRRTMDTAEGLGMAVSLLPELDDVDRPEDLELLERSWGKDRLADALGRITIVIPTLNEVGCLDATLKPLLGANPVGEVIVVDAGSVDGTAEKARACGAKVIATSAGRAHQMNAGAAEATGSILVFLHADTRLPDRFQHSIRDALRKPGVAAGAFQFRLDDRGRGYRVLEWLTNWRARTLQMPYGDQALFMKAETFRALGGFPDLPIMEDFEMVRRLKRRGRVSIVPMPAVTSARRWQKRGIIRTTILNQVVIAGYLLGVSPQTLARWYLETDAKRDSVSA